MNTFVIEKNIPLPEKKTGAKSVYADLMKRLDVGDSVLFDTSNFNKTVGICEAARKLGMKMASRKVDKGIRVWRVL